MKKNDVGFLYTFISIITISSFFIFVTIVVSIFFISPISITSTPTFSLVPVRIRRESLTISVPISENDTPPINFNVIFVINSLYLSRSLSLSLYLSLSFSLGFDFSADLLSRWLREFFLSLSLSVLS